MYVYDVHLYILFNTHQPKLPRSLVIFITSFFRFLFLAIHALAHIHHDALSCAKSREWLLGTLDTRSDVSFCLSVLRTLTLLAAYRPEQVPYFHMRTLSFSLNVFSMTCY